MKRYILLFLAVSFSILAIAQINNAGFEDWTQNTGYENPDGWQTPNNLTVQFGAVDVVKKSSDASEGTYAALLHTQFVATANANVPGVITNGAIIPNLITGEVTVAGGVAISFRPEKLTFDYKYFPGSGDSALAFAILTKYDQGSRDTIGLSVYIESDSVKTYTEGELAINYLDPATPDTLLILFSSSVSADAATAGSRLWIDNVKVHYFTGEELPLSKALELSIHPNPASVRTIVTNPYPTDRMVEVYSLEGRKVYQQVLSSGQQAVPVEQLEAGVYLFKLETRADEVPIAGRLVVQ